MAELADAPDLGSGVFDVQVQVLLSAVKKKAKVIKTFVFFLGRIASWNLPVQGLRSAPVGAKPRSPGPRAVSAPLRSAQGRGPPDLVRPVIRKRPFTCRFKVSAPVGALFRSGHAVCYPKCQEYVL